MMSPSSFEVFALKFLQKSMMFTPCGPSAVPTGGAGVALPAWICSFTIACTFFAIYLSPRRSRRRGQPRRSRRGSCQSQRSLCSGKIPSCSLCPSWFTSSWCPRSDLLHLQKVQFHRRRAAEDRHHHLQRVLVEVHIVDHAVEAGERPFVDTHVLALFEHVLRLRFLRRRLDLRQNLIDFVLAERRWLRAGAHEAGDLRRVLHH